ncbi:MAG: TatD family hydrolase [Burkholderiales bacterium]|nr:TatD family hydrolase [Burkholderiales bacterium]
MLIDTHCHLDAEEFDPDRNEVIERARAAGVSAFVIPAVEHANFEKVLEISATHLACHPALGIHPMYVDRAVEEDLEALKSRAPESIAIGEIGLDFYIENFDRDRQVRFFEAQLRIARELDLPVLLHIRRAQDAVLSILRRIRVKGGIAHAFNGSFEQAREFHKLGFRLGFGGAVTHDRATRIRGLAENLPLEAIVLETDSPDMPPSFIGRARNSPEYLPQIAKVIADLRKMPEAELAFATTENAKNTLELE